MSFDALKKRYASVRRVRRDGNCFYRSFLFQLFEYFIVHNDEPDGRAAYKQFLKTAEESKHDLTTNVGYDEGAIGDLYEAFVSVVKKLESVDAENA